MIINPILPGFNPDPCICRKGDDYYMAVSTFEWFPGIPVYHSKDLKNWELYTHVITDDEKVDLKKLPSAKGIWAPCLTYCEEEDMFYVVYGVMNSMNARYFDVDNFLICAKDIRGPWSEPGILFILPALMLLCFTIPVHWESNLRILTAVIWDVLESRNSVRIS